MGLLMAHPETRNRACRRETELIADDSLPLDCRPVDTKKWIINSAAVNPLQTSNTTADLLPRYHDQANTVLYA